MLAPARRSIPAAGRRLGKCIPSTASSHLALRRTLCFHPLRRLPLSAAPAAFQACLERFHQVDDLRLWRFGRLFGDLVALDLLLDLVENAPPHVVLVRLGAELLGSPLVNDLDGHVELALLDFGL